MSGKNFMSYGDADTILTEFSNDIKSRVSTKANQGLTSQQIANAKANIDIDKVPNVATNDQTPTFLEESTRTNIASGDKLSLIFGKIKKFFSDLKAVAFSGSYNDLSDTPTLVECSTARNVAAKTVTLPGFKLKTGARISVRFTDTSSSNPASGHITLNVNGTGAKEIVDGHTNMSILGATSGWIFNSNLVNDFIYDGTYWVWMNRDNNTTYSSKAAASGGTATSLCTTGEKYIWNNKANTSDIPTALSDLTDDSTHRTVTDTEKTTWNGKVNKKTTMDSYYGTSSTAADTAAKVITVTDDCGNFSLRAGIAIMVKFSAVNTAQNPTFNVNNTGAKPVFYNTAVVTTGTLWAGGNTRPARYVYDGTNWVWMGQAIDSNTTYSAMSKAELTTGTATSLRTVRADYLKAGIEELIDGKIAGKADKSLLEEGNAHFQFGVDANGNYGYHKTVGGADTVIPFKTVGTRSGAITANGTYTAKTDISKDGYESVTVSVSPNLQSKTVTAGTANVTVSPDASYEGLSSVVVQPTPSQSKSVTPSTSAQTVSPDSGKLLSSVSVGAISTQTKSATPSTSAQTITPDSGKYLTSVSVGAIPNLHTTNSMIVPRWGTGPGSSVPATRVATLNPRIDFNNSRQYGNVEMVEIAMPEGYYAWSYGNSSCCIPTETKTVTAGTSATTVTPTEYNTANKFVKFLKSVTVNPTPSQQKTVTASMSNITVTPDSGKLLSKVIVNTNVDYFFRNPYPNDTMRSYQLSVSSGITAYKYIFFRVKLTTSLTQYEQLIGINTSNYTKYSMSVTNLGTLSNVIAYAMVVGSHTVFRPIQWISNTSLKFAEPIVITGKSDGTVYLNYKTDKTHWGYVIPLEGYGIKA